MGMLQNRNPPRLPDAPVQYSQTHTNGVMNILRQFFDQINAVQNLNVASLNININSLPTDADIATLRSGDIYRDTGAGNVIKIVP